MLRLLKLCVIVCAMICACGCRTRTVVIDRSDDVVRLGRGVRGPVYIWENGGWVLVGNTTLPEGWFASPGPEE